MVKAIGTLRIYNYKDREDRPYKLTYFNGHYYFVHINKQQLSNCILKTSKTNKKYFEYSGQFLIDKNVIDII